MNTTLKIAYRSNARQMELGLPPSTSSRRVTRRQRRLPGAHWWFQQMRQAVLNTASAGSGENVWQETGSLPALRAGLRPTQS